jgi:hypothetical protein
MIWSALLSYLVTNQHIISLSLSLSLYLGRSDYRNVLPCCMVTMGTLHITDRLHSTHLMC